MAFSQALAAAERLDDPSLAGVTDPVARLRVEGLHQRVRAVQVAVAEGVGAPLGVSAGFNSLDGD